MHKIRIICLCFSVLWICSCSTARKIVIRPGQGGIIAIPDSEARRGRAESIMSDVCNGKKVKIVEERESLAGNVIERSSDKAGTATVSTQDPTLSNSSEKHSREE